MTLGAIPLVDSFALGGEAMVDFEGIRRRLEIPDPGLDPLDPVQIQSLRSSAGAKSGAEVALIHRAVVAVPMHPLTFAASLIPDRHVIGRPNRAVIGHVEVKDQNFVRVKGVNAAGTPKGPFEYRRRLLGPIHQRFSGWLDRQFGYDSIDEAEILAFVDRRHHVFSRETFVLGAAKKKVEIVPEIQLVGGSSEIGLGFGFGRLPHGCGVTERAGGTYTLKRSDCSLREAYRPIHPYFLHNAYRAEPTRR